MRDPQPTTAHEQKELNSSQIETGAASIHATTSSTSGAPRRLHPLKIAMVLLSIVLIVLIGIIAYTSNLNTKRYYLKSYEGALEIWKGTFSPAGKRRLMIMPGVKPPDQIKPVYVQQEIYPLIFQYYIDRADALIHMPEMFDFTGIKTYLNRALQFATSDDHRSAVYIRLNRIDRVILYYKADVAASKGTAVGLEAAIGFLNQAASLEPDEIEAELIEKKKKNIRELMKAF
jgi:hypothetical protein